jgi:hypothetical protein
MTFLDAINSVLGSLQSGDSVGQRLLGLFLQVTSFLGSDIGLLFFFIGTGLFDLGSL